MRPELLVAVAGTGTDIGKTWVTAAVSRQLREWGRVVRARKPAQSFDPADSAESRDATVLAGATGEAPDEVCPPHRHYEVAMAPPIAAAVLGRPEFTVATLAQEIQWPPAIDVGFVETAGGVRSPIADDGDNVALLHAVAPDATLLVADAGLGTINVVRLSLDALGGGDVLVVLNRYDSTNETHRRNLSWLEDRDGLTVVVTVVDVAGWIDQRLDTPRTSTSIL